MAKPNQTPKWADSDVGSMGLGGYAKEFAKADDFYSVTFTTLNNPGATGGALFALNDQSTPTGLLGDTLADFMGASNLELNEAHLHDADDMDGTEAEAQPPSADTDGDGSIELADATETDRGGQASGDIIMSSAELDEHEAEAQPPSADTDGDGFIQLDHKAETDRGGRASSDIIMSSAELDEHEAEAQPPSADTDGDAFIQLAHPTETDRGGQASGDIIVSSADVQEYEIVLHGLSFGTQRANSYDEVHGVAESKLVLPVASGVIERFDDAHGLSALTRLGNALEGHGYDSWFM